MSPSVRARAVRTRHEAAARELEALLARARSAALGPPLGDGELAWLGRQLRAGLHDGALAALDGAIEAAAGPVRGNGGHELALELLAVRGQIAELRVAELTRQLAAVRRALGRLAEKETTAALWDAVAEEASVSCRLSRVVISRISGRRLTLRASHWTHEPDWMEQWVSFASMRPASLTEGDPELRMVRDHRPFLAAPAAGRAMDELTRAGRSTRYAAAPLVVSGQVLAAVHADRYFLGAELDEIARELLATYTAGVAALLERSALRRRLDAQTAQLRDLATAAADPIDALDLRSGEEASPAGPSLGLRKLLSPRELEVAALLAGGASNAAIASELVISEATAKSHVRHVLHKLGASNRAHAATRYMQLQGPGGHPPSP